MAARSAGAAAGRFIGAGHVDGERRRRLADAVVEDLFLQWTA